MLADTVRTDRARLRPLSVDSAATVTLRMTVRAVALWSDAVQDPLTMADKLRAAFPRTTDEAAVADEASS